MKIYNRIVLVLGTCLWAVSAHAALFEDDEARKAILDLRQRVEASRLETEQRLVNATRQSADENALLRRSLLDLQNMIEALRTDMAKIRGQNEQLARDVAEVQRIQKDSAQSLEDRLRKFEPTKVTLEGKEFTAEPAEIRDYEAALAIFRRSEFSAAQNVFTDFVKRYPRSGYLPSALFWLGNAQYATGNYKDAISNFRALLLQSPDHFRAPEAVLSIANCQVELKDLKGARKTLEELIKAYPQSEAAGPAKDRLARMK